MNKLPLHKRVQILSMLVEGSSMRSISRVVGCSINTVTKLLVQAGKAAAAYHDEHVRDVKAARIQCDEIWSFCYAKERAVRTAMTNAFSKKIENHCHALALYFLHYNFCRIHKTLRVSPAMAAGVTDTLRDMEWIVSLIDARAPGPGPRGPYKKKNSK